MSYIVDSGENDYVFDTFKLMGIDHVKKEIRFSVCNGCSKIYIYGEEPDECCAGFTYESHRVADIIGPNYNFAIERKKGQDLADSLYENRLYDQLERLRGFFGSNVALVFEGSLERLILDRNNKSRIGQILSIPATCAQYGVSFIQISNLVMLIKMLKYFNEKAGKEPKIRLKYKAIDQNLPNMIKLLSGGIKGINFYTAQNIFSVYDNVTDLGKDLRHHRLRKIPRIGKVMEQRLRDWLT